MKRIFIAQYWQLQLSQDIAEGFFDYYASRNLPWSVQRLSASLLRQLKHPPTSWDMDAIIMPFTDQRDPLLQGLLENGQNVVVTHHMEDRFACPQVDIDHRAVGEMAREYLAACGYDAILGVSDSPVRAHRRRFTAFEPDRGTEAFRLVVLDRRNDQADDLRADLQSFMEQHPDRRNAIFCTSDMLAGSVIDLLADARYEIPADVAVLGADNEKLISTHYSPPISSIQTDYYKVGYEAARLTEELIAGRRRREYRPVLIPPVRVVERLSTGLAHLHNPKLERALIYLKEHAFEPLTIPETARAGGMSVRLLQKLFREEFRTSPLEYVLQIRINRAKELLQKTDMTIDEIADTIGYARGHTLSKLFRKATGLSPGAFRKQFRNM